MERSYVINWFYHRFKSGTNYTDFDVNFIINYIFEIHGKRLDQHQVIHDIRRASMVMPFSPLRGYMENLMNHAADHFSVNLLFNSDNQIIKIL